MSISAVVMVADPEAFRYTVMFWVVIVGAMVSITVTVAVAESTFPFTSVMVSITVLAPTSAQSKSVLSNAMV